MGQAHHHGPAHDHEHGHDHVGHAHHGHHGHSHTPSNFGATFLVAIGLNVLIVLAQVGFGLVSHSVALLADAGHNFSDVLGLCAAYAAHRAGQARPSPRFTYGLGGTSILAALGNAVVLLIAMGALSWEAVLRFMNPEPVETGIVMVVAAAGIVINAFAGYLLARGGGDDLNVRAAVAHLLADAGVSAGVVVGAFLIKLTGAQWIDPLLSLVINGVIVVGTWSLLRESIAMSLAGVPRTIEPREVRTYLEGLPGVAGLHDLHIWPMSTSQTALTAHLVMPEGHPGDAFLTRASEVLREEHRIVHATLQIETSRDGSCRLHCDHP